MTFSFSWLAEWRDLCAPPSLRRRAAITLSFLGLGLIAGASGLALIAVENDSDPRSAFAFAPPETASVATAAPIASTEVPAVKPAAAPNITAPDDMAREIAERKEDRSPCPSASRQEAQDRCVSAPESSAELGVAASEPAPAPATTPAGENSPAPAIPRSAPAATAESAPVVEASGPHSADALPAPVASPVAAAKPQKAARQQSGNRRAYQYQPSHRRRYAQQPFWPFW